MSNEPRTHDLNTIVNVANNAISGDADHAVERFEAGSRGGLEALKIHLKDRAIGNKINNFSVEHKLSFFPEPGDSSIIYLLKSQIDAAGPAALMSALERMDRSSLGLPPAPAEADLYDTLMLARAANAINDLNEDDKEPLILISRSPATPKTDAKRTAGWLSALTSGRRWSHRANEGEGFYVAQLNADGDVQAEFNSLNSTLNDRLGFVLGNEEKITATLEDNKLLVSEAQINALHAKAYDKTPQSSRGRIH